MVIKVILFSKDIRVRFLLIFCHFLTSVIFLKHQKFIKKICYANVKETTLKNCIGTIH